MEPGDITVARTLPIDGALLGEVLLRLRRDAGAASLHWTLGDRGSAEVDVHFVATTDAWTTSARIWDASGLAVASVTLEIESAGDDDVTLALAPTSALTTAWQARLPDLLDLVHAVVD